MKKRKQMNEVWENGQNFDLDNLKPIVLKLLKRNYFYENSSELLNRSDRWNRSELKTN